MKTWKSNLKHLTKQEYEILKEMCRTSKNVYNCSVYNIRQHFFKEGEFLRYEANYYAMKDDENYQYLGAAIAQGAISNADEAFKSFFALLKKYKQGTYANRPSLPGYLPKDGMYKLEFPSPKRQQKHLEAGYYLLPMSRQLSQKYNKHRIKIIIPEHLRNKKINQIHILPRCNGRYFEACFIFDDDPIQVSELDSEKALAIDLGVNNFATCATSEGDSFIIDGRYIKSINQGYNKKVARLSSIKDHQKIEHFTNHQYAVVTKRNRQIQDFIYCSAKYIVNYCLEQRIQNIVIGYNAGFQQNTNLGNKNNQTFVMLPYGRFKDRLEYLCSQYGIKFIKQEESYTSKASFFEQDEMPVYNPDNPGQGQFTGKRVKRGLYQRQNGQTLNADVNGALNILRKSSVVDLTVLYSRGVVVTPARIRLSGSRRKLKQQTSC